MEIEDKGPQEPPTFVVPLQADLGDVSPTFFLKNTTNRYLQVEEGEPIHLECQVNPINDNSLKIIWLRDGQSLPHGHRFRTFYDFGFVSLDILGFYAQDAGTYTCRAENSLGQAETVATIRCARELFLNTLFVNFFAKNDRKQSQYSETVSAFRRLSFLKNVKEVTIGL